MKKLLIITIFAVAVGISGQVQALGELEFSQGVSLYKKGQYAAALTRFEAARQSGMNEPRLDFNLALCYFKLRKYEQAVNYFFQAGRHKPLDGLVSFNLGLLELERGNREEATQWFEHVRDTASETKLRALAKQRLELLHRDVVAAEATTAIWEKGYRLYFGFDDNIEDPAQNGTTDKGDSFTALMAHVTRVHGAADSLRFSVIGFLQHYNTVRLYDLDLLHLKLDKGFIIDQWHNRVGVEVERTSLGGDPYLQTVRVHMSGELPVSRKSDLRLRYRYSTIDELTQRYDYLSGNRHELELRWQNEWQQWDTQVSYEFELNERNDYTGITTFSSYSPTRHTLDLRMAMPIGGAWELNGRINWRSSHYGEANILADSSRVKRSDVRSMLVLGANYTLSDVLDIDFEYKFMDNHSNITNYRYTRNLYTISLNGTF